MKVKELCEVIDEQQDISVCHNNKDLDGGYPSDFLDCELVVKRISVVACEVILIETEKKGTKNGRLERTL